MVPPIDLQKLFIIIHIQRYQIVLRQFVDHSPNSLGRQIISGENLGLDLLQPDRVPASVVAKVPEPNEQKTSIRRTFDDLSVTPKLGLYSPDSWHNHLSLFAVFPPSSPTAD